MKRVTCTLKIFYDPETYIYEWEDNIPTDEEIISRCKEMMLEDIRDTSNDLSLNSIVAEFTVDDLDPKSHQYLGQDTFGCDICGVKADNHG
jgi:hypothetical protein